MFSFLGKVFGFSKSKISVLVVGLDNSGKTTLISRLQSAGSSFGENVTPTVGFTVEKLTKDNVEFTIFDMSGQSAYRGLWESYYSDVDGIIWVLDSTDRLRITIAKCEIETITCHENLQKRRVPLLIYANKMDLHNSLSPVECMQLLNLDSLKGSPWHIAASNALSGEGVDDGLKWLSGVIKNLRSQTRRK